MKSKKLRYNVEVSKPKYNKVRFFTASMVFRLGSLIAPEITVEYKQDDRRK